jgi:predicted  nucleic acid-binding Zn-ribbon protein
VYGGVCPADLEPAFEDAYQAGRKLWRLESQLNDANHGIAYRRAEIERIDEALAASGFSVVGEASTPEERAQALLDAKSLAERRGRLKAELATLERDRGHYEAELEEYREELAYNY